MTSRHQDEDFSILLPTLNEADNIKQMIETISKLHPHSRIIVLDDNSADGTAEKAKACCDGSGRVRVIVREPGDRGLSASIISGIQEVNTKYFVVMDADFQHPPESIIKIMTSLENGSDLAIGVREDKMNLPFMRKLASEGANDLARNYLRLKRQPISRDTMSGFFGGRTDLFQEVIHENSTKFERQGFKALFDFLKYAPRDLKIDEVEFRFNARRGGESKLNSRIVLSILHQCGIGGKVAAVMATFFLTTMIGRYLAAVLLGLISTFSIIALTGGDVWTETFSNYTLLSLALAIGLMVVASGFIRYFGRESLSKSIALILVAFGAYAINLYVFYMLATMLPVAQIIASLLGLAIAFGYDTIGSKVPKSMI